MPTKPNPPLDFDDGDLVIELLPQSWIFVDVDLLDLITGLLESLCSDVAQMTTRAGVEDRLEPWSIAEPGFHPSKHFVVP